LASGGADLNGGSPSATALSAVHQRVLRDSSLQFDFNAAAAPKMPHEPAWMQALGRALAAIFEKAFPILKVVFEVGVVLAVAMIVFLIAREIVGVRFSRRRRGAARHTPADWRPEERRARALLADADRLAAAGDFDRAAHLLLHRSIEDIDGRRPRLLRPALTARDIARLDAVPGPARVAFMTIAGFVEASFFGGRALGPEAFAECRRSYEAFAFPGAWT